MRGSLSSRGKVEWRAIGQEEQEEENMKHTMKVCSLLLAAIVGLAAVAGPAGAGKRSDSIYEVAKARGIEEEF
jgi:hypothetical protein